MEHSQAVPTSTSKPLVEPAGGTEAAPQATTTDAPSTLSTAVTVQGPSSPAASPMHMSAAGVQHQPLTMSWEDIVYTVEANTDKKRVILKGISGSAYPGRALAIMGSSGAGKTTFLNAIADRLATSRSLALSGTVRMGGVPYQRSYRKLIGFVTQDDILPPTATPQEALQFSIRTRCGVSRESAIAATNATITKLKLEGCRDTVVGIPGLVIGLSGGERKRVNIATELIAEPSVLLLDEPTSGLDSVTAVTIVATLQQLAAEGHTVIFTIHQPTAQCLAHFDDVMLLCQGGVAYHGPMDKAVDYFASIGHDCPATHTPSDYFMALLQNDSIGAELVQRWEETVRQAGIQRTGALIHAAPPPPPPPPNAPDEAPSGAEGHPNEGKALSTPPSCSSPSAINARIDDTATTTVRKPATTASTDSDLKNDDDNSSGLHRSAASPLTAQVLATYVAPLQESDPITTQSIQRDLDALVASRHSDLGVQFQELFARSFGNIRRNRMFIGATVVTAAFFAIVAGLLFIRLSNDQTGIQDRMGLLFMIGTNQAMTSIMGAVNTFPPDRAVFKREQQSAAYSVSIYFLTKTLSELPLQIFGVLLNAVIVYFLSGLVIDAGAFWYFTLILFISQQAGIGIGLTVSASIENYLIATGTLPMIFVPMMVTGGLLASTDRLRPYWYWVEKLSLPRYSFILLVKNEFSRLTSLSCDVGKYGKLFCANQPKNGNDVVVAYGLNGDQDQVWICWVALVGFVVVMRIWSIIALHLVARSKA